MYTKDSIQPQMLVDPELQQEAERVRSSRCQRNYKREAKVRWWWWCVARSEAPLAAHHHHHHHYLLNGR
ncbi:hypothetical protein E2C01_064837 [Portunus trituberculatus]|uniref:Uncharacterized protein n=1 Tax=Portunus trituberculatus TaxID=210409 RepID=A0A5B7HLX2_PORTR|nr:hypothetical protein [Portunus trituberculatus]